MCPTSMPTTRRICSWPRATSRHRIASTRWTSGDLAAGRLSELYGPSQVEADSYIRTLGWRRVAEEELALLSASTRRYLDAYASGVNAYIRGKPAAVAGIQRAGRRGTWTTSPRSGGPQTRCHG